MADIEYRDGDVLMAPWAFPNGGVHVIGHQVNCQGVMGAGLAAQIKKKYPRVFDEYSVLCRSHQSGMGYDILGRAQLVHVEGNIPWPGGPGRVVYVANVFGQNRFGRGQKFTDYEALRNGLQHLRNQTRHMVHEYGRSGFVHLPWGMGAGLAGGDWGTIQGIIEDVFGPEMAMEVYIWRL